MPWRESRSASRPGASRRSWALGLGQVDADAHPRRPGPAHERAASPRRRRAGRARRRALTNLRRDKVGFIFQTFNLLSGPERRREHPAAPLDRRARASTASGSIGWSTPSGSATASTTARPSSPEGSSSGSPSPARWSRGPAVVFADEPTGNLDSKASGDVLGLLRRAVDEFGQTVVMVTHDAHAASYADRLLVLADGRIVHDGEALDAERRARPDEGASADVRLVAARLRAAQAAGAADGHRDRPRGRADGRHLHPDRHDQPLLRVDLRHRQPEQGRRRHAQETLGATASRRDLSDPRSDDRAGPRRAGRRGGLR